MSEKAVNAFLEKLYQDAALREQLEADAPDVVASAVALGGRNGFEFTADEFVAVVQATGRELSEEELERVAGGADKDTATQLISNILKSQHETLKAILGNLKA